MIWNKPDSFRFPSDLPFLLSYKKEKKLLSRKLVEKRVMPGDFTGESGDGVGRENSSGFMSGVHDADAQLLAGHQDGRDVTPD